VLTTGEVARICHVAPRTVSKWFDCGQLRGYRIPGSRDRRIPLDALVAFMRANGMPLTSLDRGAWRVLVVSREAPAGLMEQSDDDGIEVRHAANGFEAGVVAQQFRPHAVVLEVGADPAEAVGMCRNVKASAAFGSAAVIAGCRDGHDHQGQWLLSQGFDAWAPMTSSLSELARTAESLPAG
jgi:excisionase family DNA binding protein